MVGYGVGGIALLVLFVTSFATSPWGIVPLLLGLGYLVKAGFETYQLHVEAGVARLTEKSGRTLRQLERDRRALVREIWGYRDYEILMGPPINKLKKIEKEIAERKKELNAK